MLMVMDQSLLPSQMNYKGLGCLERIHQLDKSLLRLVEWEVGDWRPGAGSPAGVNWNDCTEVNGAYVSCPGGSD